MAKNYTLGLYEKAMPSTFSFAEMLETTKSCGFDRLELSVDETDDRLSRLDWSDKQKQELAQLSKDTGVPILTMCLSGHRKYPLGSHDAATRQRALDISRKAVDFSAQVGIRLIQLAGYDVYYEEHDDFTQAMFRENLYKTVQYAAKCGVALGFETMETPFMDTVSKAMAYVKDINSAWLGVYPDVGNLQNAAVLYGTDICEDIMSGAGHIFAMHLKETKPGVYRDMRFGSGGHTPYEACLACAKQQQVRMFTGEFWYLGGDDYLEEIKTSAKFLREKIDRIYSDEE